MIDQLIIGDKASYDDFEASVKERKNNKPKKKSIKETVPFSNVTYDFSAINGETYWEERTLEYVFEITANTPEELEEKKQLFTSWIMNVMEAELHDPFVLNYHFLATFDSIDIDDSEIEKSTITVTFTAYPYMIANAKKVYEFALTTEGQTVTIVNDSSHRVKATANSDVKWRLESDGNYSTYESGERVLTWPIISVGANVMAISATETPGTLTIEFTEEVF